MKYLNSQIDFVNNEADFLSSDKEETVIVTLKQTEAIYCADKSCNTEWCKEHNVPFIQMETIHSIGGCIIGVKGNIFMNVKRFNKGGECLSDKFTKAVTEYFKSKGLKSARHDNNDIIIDNFKVGSAVETIHNEWLYMSAQLSIHQDIETIKMACNKPMVKVPKALSEYGITTEEMISFCEEYFKNN